MSLALEAVYCKFFNSRLLEHFVLGVFLSGCFWHDAMEYINNNYNAPVILLPAHPASFVHKFLFQRVPASPGMQ